MDMNYLFQISCQEEMCLIGDFMIRKMICISLSQKEPMGKIWTLNFLIKADINFLRLWINLMKTFI